MKIFERLIRLQKGISPTADIASSHVSLASHLYNQQEHLLASSARPLMEEISHASLTSSSPRQPVLADARIREVRQITPSVKRLRLHVEDERFGFQPGQWVDFHAPAVATIGGYSIVSPPSQLKYTQTFDIAVKESGHPPAFWVHNQSLQRGQLHVKVQAVAGVPVKVQVGGDFVLSDTDLERPLILLAGGIGITPLMAMVSHFVELVPSLLKRGVKAAATLLYSASSSEELAFRVELDDACRRSLGTLDVRYFVTRGAGESAPEQHFHVEDRRMHVGDLTHAWQQMSAGHIQADHKGPIIFVCGPPGMISHLTKHAQEGLGVPSSDVRSEQWW